MLPYNTNSSQTTHLSIANQFRVATPSMKRIQSATLIGTILRIMDNSSHVAFASQSVILYFLQMFQVGYSKNFCKTALRTVCNKNDHISTHRKQCADFMNVSLLPWLWITESKSSDDAVMTSLLRTFRWDAFTTTAYKYCTGLWRSGSLLILYR